MRRLFYIYINGNHIIWLRSTSSNTQVIRNYGPQSRGTAGALIFWLQVSGITWLFAYCKGGNFNIHIWAWFGYLIC